MQLTDAQQPRWHTWLWLLVLLLASWTYVDGLGSQYAPSNGDEMVYVHIAQATAQTGHWLPLASELENMRNTKPPLLFWQAMVAGDWGQRWTLAALRTPSVIYLLLTALGVAAVVRAISRSTVQALMAACIFLAFLSTFRYGRTYLTSAPETFWLSLPLFGLLWQRLQPQPVSVTKPEPSLLWCGACGLALGLGLAYKSFALIAPAAAAWWLASVLSAPRPSWFGTFQITLKVGLSAALALAVFALWFALDPDPASVWQEFVLRENAVKMSDDRGYWQGALALDGSSLWAQALAYPVNAGLLFAVVLGLAWLGLHKLTQASKGQAIAPATLILLAWVGVWLVVFLLPSQRSARYVIPAMPAVAILLGLYWHCLARLWFIPTLLLCPLAALMLCRIAWTGHALGLYSEVEITLVLVFALAGGVCTVLGLIKPAATRNAALLSVLLLYGTFNLTAAPMDGPVGRYADSLEHAAFKKIAVPNGFNGQFERYRFLLTGDHQFVPFDTEGRALGKLAPGQTLAPGAQLLGELLTGHDAVVWIQSDLAQDQPPCSPDCKVLGTRWLWKSRHLPGDIRWSNLIQPQDWLFRREWLVTR
jgi:4-amino-4-deoxy-L-arabinose transferase-like glycosyltransferase